MVALDCCKRYPTLLILPSPFCAQTNVAAVLKKGSWYTVCFFVFHPVCYLRPFLLLLLLTLVVVRTSEPGSHGRVFFSVPTAVHVPSCSYREESSALPSLFVESRRTSIEIPSTPVCPERSLKKGIGTLACWG